MKSVFKELGIPPSTTLLSYPAPRTSAKRRTDSNILATAVWGCDVEEIYETKTLV